MVIKKVVIPAVVWKIKKRIRVIPNLLLYIYLGTVFIDVVEKIGNKKLKKHICKQMYVLYNTYER